MDLTHEDWSAVWLTLKLAGLVTVLLLIVGTPIAWWLARTRSPLRSVVGAVVALPIVLPPTVLGFYLLIVLAPSGPVTPARSSTMVTPALCRATSINSWS